MNNSLPIAAGDAILCWDRVVAIKRWHDRHTSTLPYVFVVLDTGVVIQVEMTFEAAGMRLLEAEKARFARHVQAARLALAWKER